MKKIGLLSVFNEPNYGSMLQAYALSKAISNMGYDNEYISYSPVRRNGLMRLVIYFIRLVASIFKIDIVKQTEYSFWESKQFRCQLNLFNDFCREYIPHSKANYDNRSIYKANSNYSKYIVGSDQTWSPLVTKDKGCAMFLDFVDDDEKKFSYAPSIGTLNIPENYKTVLNEKLGRFKFLSCREFHNSLYLKENFHLDVNYVLDPTFLLEKKEWSDLSIPIDVPERYILCYILGTKRCISEYAEKLGREKNIQVFYIVTRPEYVNYKNVLKDVSVQQFLFLLLNASYIVTDSYHGSILSVNFNKNFYCFSKRENKNGQYCDNDRIIDFLNVVGLTNRFISDNEYRDEADIIYDKVNDRIKELRNSSTRYLHNILEA